uniref:(northern house mosquito) hypothetical protein n=1 Tax=Culex pipiens TaxID=7175 RepID=A0A8D8J7L1_CULPI
MCRCWQRRWRAPNQVHVQPQEAMAPRRVAGRSGQTARTEHHHSPSPLEHHLNGRPQATAQPKHRVPNDDDDPAKPKPDASDGADGGQQGHGPSAQRTTHRNQPQAPGCARPHATGHGRLRGVRRSIPNRPAHHGEGGTDATSAATHNSATNTADAVLPTRRDRPQHPVHPSCRGLRKLSIARERRAPQPSLQTTISTKFFLSSPLTLNNLKKKTFIQRERSK